MLLSFAWALKTVLELGDARIVEHYFNWIVAGGFQVGCDFAVDRLTAVMLLVVTGVGSLIHIYSIGYMAHEGGYYRFFAYMSLFMFFMLTLVLAANYLVLFVGWEGVGLCSYLLIGFWFHKKSATNAGNKAFIVNRIGDFGFLLAMLLIAVNFGTFDFGHGVSPGAREARSVAHHHALLLLVGACGKSAQFPLYVWLPDAMEGPTPVSALIHAATMVTAGVYMIARSFPIYLHAPDRAGLVAYIGLFTASFAATIGLAQNDIKKVFAYSTVSQLGYMFLGVGTGAFSAGIYHLMTHAFFKALLFLGAGSVIHALSGEQDMRQHGRPAQAHSGHVLDAAVRRRRHLRRAVHFRLFQQRRHPGRRLSSRPWMYWVGTITAGMTAFYVFRAMFMTFFGDYRGHEHPHESPAVMTIPLSVLAFSRWWRLHPHSACGSERSFPRRSARESPGRISVAAGLIGIGLAYVMYIAKPSLAGSFSSSLGGIYPSGLQQILRR